MRQDFVMQGEFWLVTSSVGFPSENKLPHPLDHANTLKTEILVKNFKFKMYKPHMK